MRMTRSTLERHWCLLRHIPAAPRYTTVSRLRERLEADGHRVTRRTVERDLAALAASPSFPLVCERHGRTDHWQWMADARTLEIPGMSPAAALAFHLGREYLAPLLPPATLDLLAPWFDRAEAVLSDHARTRLGRWPDRVRVLERGPHLRPPAVDPHVQRAVYDALLEERQLEIRYRGRGKARAEPRTIHPFGLVLKDGVAYLVARLWNYDDPVHLALHRIEAAEPTPDRVQYPTGFDFGEHAETDAEFSYPTGYGAMRLEVRFRDGVGEHLRERPLSDDQAIREGPEGTLDVSARVLDSDELRWWLLGFGANAEVLAPARLRRWFADQVASLHRRYEAPVVRATRRGRRRPRGERRPRRSD